jgi:hypothetical protein
MPLPISYTESSLRAYMETILDQTGIKLGLDQSDALDEAVNEVIVLVGALADQTTTAQVGTVRAAARWQALLAAQRVAVGRHDLKVGTADLKQSQVFEGLGALLKDAESDYYAALAVSQAAAGTTPFFFSTICGTRGR